LVVVWELLDKVTPEEQV